MIGRLFIRDLRQLHELYLCVLRLLRILYPVNSIEAATYAQVISFKLTTYALVYYSKDRVE